jgi:hypothetical protein
MLFAALVLAAASAPCESRRDVVTAPPAALPAAFAASYPNGTGATMTVKVDAAGKVLSVKSEAAAPLRSATIAWAGRLTFAPADADCTPADVDLNTVYFFPAASGVVGRPMIAGGVDFATLKYAGGPGNCKTVPGSGDGYDGEVEDVFSGLVAEQRVAVAVLRCEYNGHGFDQTAQVFTVGGGTARKIGTLGSGGMMSSDSPFPDWPGGWLHVSFLDGKLYADVWDRTRCPGANDWTSSAYTIRAGKLVLLNSLRHHRKGLDVVCNG